MVRSVHRAFQALLIAAVCTSPLLAAGPEGTWLEKKTLWNGYEQFHFTVQGRAAYVVAPKRALPGKPWVWRARFPNYHAEMDIALLGKGFHIGYVDVAGLYGAPQAMEYADRFYEFVTARLGLASKPALEGVSRGGLFIYNWAAENPEKVACIYADTPVCDFKSWPGGKGKGLGSAASWKQCLKAYRLSEDEALGYDKNPVDRVEPIAKAKIPILHIVSENDRVVPPAENTYLLKQRLERLGHSMDVIRVAHGTAQSHGHHFTHPDPQRVVDFIMRHAAHPR